QEQLYCEANIISVSYTHLDVYKRHRQYIVDEIQYEEDRKWCPNIFVWILHE
ncbi:hypothetical protein A5848_002545, partial [Enterococcus faecium]